LICLERVVVSRAVITEVAYPVSISVELIEVREVRAVVCALTDAILVVEEIRAEGERVTL
jgi:hypothetical protein